jgi:hypothetical protein
MAITDQITGGTSPGDGLDHFLARTNNLSDLETVATARANLGLTALATTTPGTGVATFLTTPSSANLAAALTDESGNGVVVFDNDATLTTPLLVMSYIAAGDGGAEAQQTLLAGPITATAVGGGDEYDGKVFYRSPENGNRGIDVTEHVVCLTSANTLTNSTAIQPIFDGGGGPANGAITLVSGTYFIDMLLNLSGLSGSAHTITLTFGGTATISSIRYGGTTVDSATLALNSSSAAQAVGTAGTTTQTLFLQIRGIVRVSVGGTFISQITQGTNAAAASVATDSYLRLHSIGAHTVASVGAWS